MRKDTEKRTKETNIGKIIYGFLLFMPLLAIFITCGYAMFNKNAYQSYYGETINNSQLIETNIDDLEEGNIYYVNTNGNYTLRFDIYISDFENITLNTTNDNVTHLICYKSGSGNERYVELRGTNNEDYGYLRVDNNNYQLKFNYLGMTNTSNCTFNFFIEEFNQVSFLSEVFYYSVDKVEQSNLFNWAQNSVIYTGIYNTCQQLSITNTFIPMLMAYWLIISVVYILYDIILMMLILFHRKVHELQESI